MRSRSPWSVRSNGADWAYLSPTHRHVRRAIWFVLSIPDRLLAPIDARRRPIAADQAPVFVAGCSHSGTTIITALLNRHPHIHCLPVETKIMCQVRTRRAYRRWLRDGLRDVEAAGKQRLCEKTPNHVFHIRRIQRLFPEARIVIVERDGRDVALSLVDRWKGRFRDALEKWIAAVQSTMACESDPRVLVVRYEEFVRDPDETAARICTFLGEPTSDGMTRASGEFWAINYDGPPVDGSQPAPEGHEQYRAWQVNQPIFDGSGRWKAALTAEQSSAVDELAKPLLSRRGYEVV